MSRKRGVAVHAWFFDFAEGADSYVARQHPEWLARNPEGQPTTSEMLRGQPYRLAWMCPARRPGYTDQWLVPLIVEFATRYEVDAIHHDSVRYPGDLAPDTYCFCDDCLRELPKYASYYSPSRPDDPLASPFDRPHLEAHWERRKEVTVAIAIMSTRKKQVQDHPRPDFGRHPGGGLPVVVFVGCHTGWVCCLLVSHSDHLSIFCLKCSPGMRALWYLPAGPPMRYP